MATKLNCNWCTWIFEKHCHSTQCRNHGNFSAEISWNRRIYCKIQFWATLTKFLLKLLESEFFVFPQCVCSLHDILMHSISWHWNCIMGFELLLLLNVISNFVHRTTTHLSKIDASKVQKWPNCTIFKLDLFLEKA